MRYFRQPTDSSSTALVVEREGTCYDLTAADPDLDSFRSLAQTASIMEETVDTVAERHLADAHVVEVDGPAERDIPLVPTEVWAAGVTYHISEKARQSESDKPQMYIDVYEADRPEIFFKATASRTVGPNDTIGIRQDSDWDVPEPELALVLYRGSVVGYTVGNDVSSRDIEGANPLYLPQAKVYDRCCALGPCVASPETVGDPHELDISMDIERDGTVVFSGTTSTAEMVRTYDELVSYLTRHNDVPDLGVLLTGTSLVPEDDFSLRRGDGVHIDIENIGTLYNEVTVV
jgi:2-dehydro-3-deoxy-D-arabinonate dehydratase